MREFKHVLKFEIYGLNRKQSKINDSTYGKVESRVCRNARLVELRDKVSSFYIQVSSQQWLIPIILIFYYHFVIIFFKIEFLLVYKRLIYYILDCENEYAFISCDFTYHDFTWFHWF